MSDPTLQLSEYITLIVSVISGLVVSGLAGFAWLIRLEGRVVNFKTQADAKMVSHEESVNLRLVALERETSRQLTQIIEQLAGFRSDLQKLHDIVRGNHGETQKELLELIKDMRSKS